MPKWWIAFVGVTVGSGGASALLAAVHPQLESLMVPPFWWPLFVALALELLMRPKIVSGELPETPMGMRAGSVIGGALLYLAVRFAVPVL